MCGFTRYWFPWEMLLHFSVELSLFHVLVFLVLQVIAYLTAAERLSENELYELSIRRD